MPPSFRRFPSGISRTGIELFLVAAVVGVRRVRSVRSDRTPQTVRTVRTGRLFGGLKSDLRGFGLAFQQPFALKGSQCPQCFAVLVLEAVAVLNYVPVGCALEQPSPFATKLQNVGHGVSGALPAACAVTSE